MFVYFKHQTSEHDGIWQKKAERVERCVAYLTQTFGKMTKNNAIAQKKK